MSYQIKLKGFIT